MKYLFFDIECSNCFNGVGKICEYGFVVTDENFNILSKNVYPMSPGKGRDCRFHLKGRKHQKDLELAWPYEYYYSQPEFPAFYNQIKHLMFNDDVICFGFSSDNDISYIYNSCKRYNLEPFDFVCYDVQKIASLYSESKPTHLKETYIKLVGSSKIAQFQEHLSSDDAHMTMSILEAVCVLSNLPSKTILRKFENTKTSLKDWVDRTTGPTGVEKGAKSNMSEEEIKQFSSFIVTIKELALSNKEKETPQVVSDLDAFKAHYIIHNIDLQKDGDALLFLTSAALLNTYVKQDNHNEHINYSFKSTLKRLLRRSKHILFNSIKMNYIDKELGGNNLIIFEFNNCYQFSYHSVPKYLNKEIPEEYRCSSEYWGIRNKMFINDLFKRVLKNKIGFSNKTIDGSNLIEKINSIDVNYFLKEEDCDE
ncbi:MAG: hypothetical protein MJ211_14305 [Bacteroidales bacterium]|nr:hypothetical protein [Bacteroidales bacterium]